jgi:hypothetical protein
MTTTWSTTNMDAGNGSRSDARRQAEDRFAKMIRRDAEVRAYQQKQWDAEAAKIARLRALRLARDAEENAENRVKPKMGGQSKRAKA